MVISVVKKRQFQVVNRMVKKTQFSVVISLVKKRQFWLFSGWLNKAVLGGY